ncbi:hypothetical protein AK812_SmicGene22163 [Symbiodinium microadriaticum]|uniref:Uncharacterized protein n=1 Tax=Symbiodinium microadriaticum TaxID=2951 RepID=A0A1Q9DKJ7_SYMMI|nr:hypothetical protein AK812_SmicGene22163 [Symbiodinium microadriaticum]
MSMPMRSSFKRIVLLLLAVSVRPANGQCSFLPQGRGLAQNSTPAGMHHNYDNNQERLACLGVRFDKFQFFHTFEYLDLANQHILDCKQYEYDIN